MKRIGLLLTATLLVAAIPAMAQDVTTGDVTQDYRSRVEEYSKVLAANRVPSKSLTGLTGMWWRNPQYVSILGLTAEQQKKMDAVFQASRVNLIDLKATLDKEEAILEPLLEAEQLDEAKALTQIDRVANARAELEKGNARMLLGFRQVLTSGQWNRVYAGTSKTVLKSNLKKRALVP
jgi:Spy/CpxP family protein refolding chaperone